jgi:proton-dependent oligopeptide transporter, POT family
MSSASVDTPRREWLGHPRGLSVLFFTEMWERFSYYGMRSLLLLFMLSPASAGGLGFSTPRGAAIYGTYTMAVYALSIPGGWIADRFLGHYRAVLVGGVLITLGHFSMALHGVATFFLGLSLIVLGTGLLKPNVSTMVGSLYSPEDARRDAGFSLFYMGINVGAMIAPLVCGYLGQKVDWHIGFASAGVGMLAGLTQYVLCRKALAPAVARERAAVATGVPELLTGSDWKRIVVILILFLFSILFWGAFEQAGSTLTLFADRYTRLSLLGWPFPSSWFQAEQPLFVIVLAPVFAWMWVHLGKRGPSSPAKFALGLFLVGLGYLILVPAAAAAQSRGVRVSPMWLTTLYLIHTLGELCLSPVGLSLVTKLAPRKVVGLMMGVWFLATAFGNRLAGWVAGFFDAIPVARLFLLVALAAIGASVLLALLIRPIRRLTGIERPPNGAPREALEAGSA